MEDSEEMRWRSLVLSLMKKAIALANPSAALLLALPQKDGTSCPLFGRIAFIPEKNPSLLFPAWPKSVSVTTEFDQVIALFYFGRSLAQVPPVPPVSVSPVLSLPIPLAAPQLNSVLDHISYPCLKQLAIFYRLFSILHIPLKIEMLTIGGETSIVNEVFCNDLHCILD